MLEIDPDYGVMKCPHCGDIYTHIDAVVVNNASQDQVAVVAVGEDKDSHIDVTIRKSTAKYYDRRHTIRLEIDCETCYTRTSISLKQVKGSTEVTMVNYPSIAYNLEGI